MICFKEGHIKKMQSLAPIAKAKRSDALAIWHRVTLETVLSNGPDLSSRRLLGDQGMMSDTSHRHQNASKGVH